MLCYVMLCYVMLCYVMLCYVMLCCVVLCCVVLYFILFYFILFYFILLYYKHIVMRPFKFAASQAKCIYLYKNLRTKFQRCCADIYFNQQRLKQGVIPKYAQIKVRYTSPASITTHKKMQISRITGVTCSFGPTITFPFPRFAYNKERTRNHEVLVLYVSTVQYSTVQPAGS